MEDVILGIDGEKVLSSNDVSSRFSLIPSAQEKVVFEILRGKDKLIVSCECLYHPPVDLTPIYDTKRMCSLRVVLDREGNRIMVAPIRYFYQEFSEGGLERFESKFKQIVSESFVGEYHTLNRKRWCNNNEEAEIAIPTTLLKRRFDTDIKGNLQEILSESKKTNNSQRCYFIYLKQIEGKQFMGWSIFPGKDDIDWIIEKTNFSR